MFLHHAVNNLILLKQIKISSKFPDELLYGKTGYLWACSFLNKHLGENTIQPTTTVSMHFNHNYLS